MFGGDCGCAHATPMTGGAALRGSKKQTRTKAELYELAKKLKIPGRSTMTKEELVKAIDTKKKKRN